MVLTKQIMLSFDEKPVAKFLVPDWGDKVHLGGQVRQPYAVVDSILPVRE